MPFPTGSHQGLQVEPVGRTQSYQMVRLAFQKAPGQVGGASWRNAATISGQPEDFLTPPFWAQDSSVALRNNKEAREYKWRDRNIALP